MSNITNEIRIVHREFEDLHKEQLEVGEQIAVLLHRQLLIAEKCRHVKQKLADVQFASKNLDKRV